MSDDIARLGIEVDSRQVLEATLRWTELQELLPVQIVTLEIYPIRLETRLDLQ